MPWGIESQKVRRDRGGGRAGRRDLDGRRDHNWRVRGRPRALREEPPEMSVALVTGGSRGIGRAIVEEFAAAGYQVAFTYAGNHAAAESLQGLAKPYQADSRDFACAEKVVADVQSALGPIDVLVNNAAVKRDGALHTMDPEAWKEVIDTNLTDTFNYTRAVIKHLIRHSGSVVNITSVSGISGMAGQTN